MDCNLTLLERDVIAMLLAGDDPMLLILADQFRNVSIVRREFTGVGFFTTFVVSDRAPKAPGSKSFSIGDVIAEINGLENGAGFMLHVRDGFIDYLEGYTYDEPWPKNDSNYTLAYSSGPIRNLRELKKNGCER